MRKWLLQIHMYGGLLCAPYLIIFGFSSLQFHYHFPFANPVQGEKRTWEQDVEIPNESNDTLVAESIQESLGLMGWPVTWKTKRDAAGDIRFDLERPGKSYTISTVRADHKVRVEERPKGFWQVFNSLHALTRVPGSSWASSWGIYTEICTAFLVLASVSGLYLWLDSKRERAVGWAALASAALVSIGLILFVVFRG